MSNIKNFILYRQIGGALKATIIAHGPIHRKFISSATKRTIGMLNKYDNISFPDEPLKEKLLMFLQTEHYRLELFRKKLKNPNIKASNKSHISGKSSELLSILKKLNNILEFCSDAKSIDDTHTYNKNNELLEHGNSLLRL